MRARPVIGGMLIKMLEDPAIWKKWASRDQAKVGGWAPRRCRHALPRSCRPRSTSRRSGDIRSTSRRPIGPARLRRQRVEEGPGGFGTSGTPGAVDRHDLEHARHLAAPRGDLAVGTDPSRHPARTYHDEDVDVYIDGRLAARQSGYVTSYELIEIHPDGTCDLLKPGAKVVLAVHCHQTGGGQGVDLGLVDVVETGP